MPAIDQFNGRRLYYVRNIFLLRIGTSLYEINEPIGWDKILVNLTFDKTTIRGFKFEFSDKDTTLGFDVKCGYDKLKALWESDGVDADAGFKFGEVDSSNTATIWYEAKLDFQSYQRDLYQVKLQCEKDSIASRFVARYSIAFDLEKTESLSGDLKALPPLTKYNCFLHPPFINTKSTFDFNTNVAALPIGLGQLEKETIHTLPSPPYVEQWRTFVPPLKAVSNEIPDFQEPLAPAGELIYSGLVLPNGVVRKNFSMNGKVVYRTQVAIDSSATPIIEWGLKIYKKQFISTGTTDAIFSNAGAPYDTNYVELFSQSQLVNANSVDSTDSYDYNINFEMFADEALFIKFFVHVKFLSSAVITLDYAQTNKWVMNVSSFDFIRPTSYQSYKLKDVLERMVLLITDRAGSFKSDFFTTGNGKDHFANSGKQIRSVPQATYPAVVRDAMASCNMLWNMGGSFERDNSGNEWFRFEPIEFFFRDVELVKLDVISNFIESPAIDNTYNEFEIGFKKFPQSDETGSAFDFMTLSNWILPIKNYQSKLSQLCQMLLSPYYMSYAIANSFDVNKSNQFDTDNDIFLIAFRENEQGTYTGSIIFDLDNGQIIFPDGVPILLGESVTFSGTASNNRTYVVKEVVWDNIDFPIRTVMTVFDTTAMVNETAPAGTATFTPKWIPKRDEQFDLISGVDQPKTVYNLQHHLKIVFKRWAKSFLNAIKYQKDDSFDSTLIKFGTMSNNKSVLTRLKVTEPYQTPMSPVYTAAHGPSNDADSADERAADLDYPLFGKSKFTFTAPMTWGTLDMIRKAFENRDPDGKNYGYFTFLNPDNVYQKGYLQDLKFNPITQQATIELIEKYNG